MNKYYEGMMDSILEEYGVFDEAKRIKGKEYQTHKKDLEDPDKNNIGNDKNTETVASTHLGSTVIDSSVQKLISNIDVEKEKSISESKDIIKEYYAYIGDRISETIDKYADGSREISTIEKVMVDEMVYLQENGFDVHYINNYLMGNYFGFEDIAKKLGFKDADEFDKSTTNSKMNDKLASIIRSMLKLRLNYVNKIIQLLSKMIQANYKQLGMSEQQMKAYLDNLSKGDNSSTQAASDIYSKIRENSKQYEINNGEGYDFRKLGFGCIFGPSDGEKLGFFGTDDNKDAMLNLIQSAMRYDAVVVAHGSDNEKRTSVSSSLHGMVDENGSDRFSEYLNNTIDKAEDYISGNISGEFGTDSRRESMIRMNIQYLFRDDFDIDKFLEMFKSENWSDEDKKYILQKFTNISYKYVVDTYWKKFMNSMNSSIDKRGYDKETAKKYFEYIENDLKMVLVYAFFYYKLSDKVISEIESITGMKTVDSYWSCQPTKTLNEGPFDDVNDVVRQLIKEGFKKIMIKDCNPGGHKLANDIMKTKGVLINHSDFSNYVESGDLYSNDPSLQYLIEAENDLKSFALECDIDYNDDAYIEECMKWYIDNQEIIQEGAWDTVKEFGKKVIAAIIGFFKKIIGYVKLAISKIKGLLFGTKEKPKNTKTKTPKIKVKLINLDSKKIDEFTAQCRDDLNDIWEKTTATISKEIKRQSELQSKLSKALERDLSKINPSSTNESYSKAGDTMIDRFSWLFGSVDEATLPGTEQTDDDDEITLGDAGEDNTEETDNTTTDDEPEAAEYNVDDATDDTATDDTGNEGEEDTGEDTEGNEDYNLPDAEDTGDEGEGNENDTNEEGENDEEGEGDYDLPDAGEGDDDTGEGDAGNEEDTGDEGGLGDDTGGTDDLIGGNGSGGDGVSDEVQIPNLRDVQQKLFDQLTEDQQKIKIENLKSNYGELYTRCANILKLITDSNPGDENTAKVFDYVQKTMTDLQTHVYYYITNTFDTKTYIENDTQFKQFLVILNTIKNILDEINIEKKE